MKSNKLLSTILASSMILSLAACSSGGDDGGSSAGTSAGSDVSSSAAADSGSSTKVGEKVFKVSFNQTLDNPEAVAVQYLSDQFYDATEGRYSFEIYPSETLGSQQQSLELVQSGAIDMAIVSNAIIEAVNPDFAILGTPYVYDDIDHQERLFNSGLLDDLYMSTESSGFITLASYGYGARNLYGTSPMTSPEELAGQKIRVMQSDTMVQMLNLMGGVGTPMGQGDVYSAIQMGTLDGAENNIITYVDLIQYEVAPHYSETNHLLVPDELVISTVALSGMSDEDVALLKELATESVSVMFDLGAELREEYYTLVVEEYGVTIHQVDTEPFRENLQDFITEVANRSDMSKAAYDAIESTR